MSCISTLERIIYGLLFAIAPLLCVPTASQGADLATAEDAVAALTDLDDLDGAELEIAAQDISCGLQENTAPDIYSLVNRFFTEQFTYLEITPPGGASILTQECGTIVFTPANYPKEFTEGLVAEIEHDCPVYTITMMEDATRNSVVILNPDGRAILAVESGAGHDPYALLNQRYPYLDSGAYSQEEIDGLRAEYSPGRIHIVMKLLPADYVEKYAAAVARDKLAADRVAEALGSKMVKGGIVPMMMYQGPAVTNLYLAAIEKKTDGMLLTLAYPGDYTNNVEFFACSDLVSNWWNSLAVTNVNTSTNWIEWLDTTASGQTFRFYAAGNADLDTDGDGLTDAREKLMYHTCATNTDSDWDGLSDSNELFIAHTDPNNSKTNKPVAFITYPANGSRKVWLP